MGGYYCEKGIVEGIILMSSVWFVDDRRNKNVLSDNLWKYVVVNEKKLFNGFDEKVL